MTVSTFCFFVLVFVAMIAYGTLKILYNHEISKEKRYLKEHPIKDEA